MVPHKVKDTSLADFGRREIEIAENEMPGLMATRKKHGPPQPPAPGARIAGGSLHMSKIILLVAIATFALVAAQIEANVGDSHSQAAATRSAHQMSMAPSSSPSDSRQLSALFHRLIGNPANGTSSSTSSPPTRVPPSPLTVGERINGVAAPVGAGANNNNNISGNALDDQFEEVDEEEVDDDDDDEDDDEEAEEDDDEEEELASAAKAKRTDATQQRPTSISRLFNIIGSSTNINETEVSKTTTTTGANESGEDTRVVVKAAAGRQKATSTTALGRQSQARDLGLLTIKAILLGPLIGLTIKHALLRGLLWAVSAYFIHIFAPSLLTSLGLGTGLVGFARQMQQPDYAQMLLPHLTHLPNHLPNSVQRMATQYRQVFQPVIESIRSIPEGHCRFRAVCETSSYLIRNTQFMSSSLQRLSSTVYINFGTEYSKAWLDGIVQGDCAAKYAQCPTSPFSMVASRLADAVRPKAPTAAA